MSKILIQCVVVLYQCAAEDAKTLQTLPRVFQQHHDLARQTALLIYDNSPSFQSVNMDRWLCGAAEYYHAPDNGGVAAAYNRALSTAQEQAIEWLLLLDQDTSLSPELFQDLFGTIRSHLQGDVAAIVPKLAQQGVLISPQRVGRFGNHDLPQTTAGVQHQQITALNSATCLRVQAVSAVGGFPPAYWLDYLDHIMFHRLQAAGGRVLVLDTFINHRLSLRNLESEMTLDRYVNMLAAEWRFIRETSWGGGPSVHRLRLLKRALLYTANLHDKGYAFRTLRAAFA